MAIYSRKHYFYFHNTKGNLYSFIADIKRLLIQMYFINNLYIWVSIYIIRYFFDFVLN